MHAAGHPDRHADAACGRPRLGGEVPQGEDRIACTFFGDGAIERRRLPRGGQLRREPRSAGDLLLPEQRLGDLGAHEDPVLGPDDRTARPRLRHGLRAVRRQRHLRRRQRACKQAAERARKRQAADVHRRRHLPARRSHDRGRRAALPRHRGGRRLVDRSAIRSSDCAATSTERKLWDEQTTAGCRGEGAKKKIAAVVKRAEEIAPPDTADFFDAMYAEPLRRAAAAARHDAHEQPRSGPSAARRCRHRSRGRPRARLSPYLLGVPRRHFCERDRSWPISRSSKPSTSP